MFDCLPRHAGKLYQPFLAVALDDVAMLAKGFLVHVADTITQQALRIIVFFDRSAENDQ